MIRLLVYLLSRIPLIVGIFTGQPVKHPSRISLKKAVSLMRSGRCYIQIRTDTLQTMQEDHALYIVENRRFFTVLYQISFNHDISAYMRLNHRVGYYYDSHTDRNLMLNSMAVLAEFLLAHMHNQNFITGSSKVTKSIKIIEVPPEPDEEPDNIPKMTVKELSVVDNCVS